MPTPSNRPARNVSTRTETRPATLGLSQRSQYGPWLDLAHQIAQERTRDSGRPWGARTRSRWRTSPTVSRSSPDRLLRRSASRRVEPERAASGAARECRPGRHGTTRRRAALRRPRCSAWPRSAPTASKTPRTGPPAPATTRQHRPPQTSGSPARRDPHQPKRESHQSPSRVRSMKSAASRGRTPAAAALRAVQSRRPSCSPALTRGSAPTGRPATRPDASAALLLARPARTTPVRHPCPPQSHARAAHAAPTRRSLMDPPTPRPRTPALPEGDHSGRIMQYHLVTGSVASILRVKVPSSYFSNSAQSST